MTAVPFSDLLSKLATAHADEVQAVRTQHNLALAELAKEHHSKVERMAAELDALRKQLAERQEHDNHEQDIPSGICAPLQSMENLRFDNESQDIQLGLSPSSKTSPAHHVLQLRSGWSRQAIWGAEDIIAPAREGSRSTNVQPSTSTPSMIPDFQITAFFDCDGGVIFPHSQFRTLWDLTSLFLIIVDVLMMPFLLAFKPDITPVLSAVEWTGLLFWTADMMQGPFLGYFHGGEYVKSRWKVAKRYAKTWLLVDLIVVVPDWVFLAAGVENSSGLNVSALVKTLKSIRILRVLRLLRLAKLKRLIRHVFDMLSTEIGFTLLNVAQLITTIALLNHILACAWYSVGNMSTSPDVCPGWVAEVKSRGDDSLGYLYLTSLHWSVTQFSTAAMDVNPCNDHERILSILVLFCAMVVFSSFVGTISDHVTRLRNMKNSVMKQLWLLRRFLRENQVTTNLSERIQKFVEHTLIEENERIHVSEMDLLKKMSAALQDELTYELHSRYIIIHQFFLCLGSKMGLQSSALHRICQNALQTCAYATGETIFGAGDEATHMFFLQSGEFRYTWATQSGCVQHMTLSTNARFHDKEAENWVAEAVLWTIWRHRGNLKGGSSRRLELVSVNALAFFDVMSKHPTTWLYATTYGEQFLTFFNSLPKVTDVVAAKWFYEEAVTLALESLTHKALSQVSTRSIQKAPADLELVARDSSTNIQDEQKEIESLEAIQPAVELKQRVQL